MAGLCFHGLRAASRLLPAFLHLSASEPPQAACSGWKILLQPPNTALSLPGIAVSSWWGYSRQNKGSKTFFFFAINLLKAGSWTRWNDIWAEGPQSMGVWPALGTSMSILGAESSSWSGGSTASTEVLPEQLTAVYLLKGSKTQCNSFDSKFFPIKKMSSKPSFFTS